ncbi:MAG: tRNA (adenosine(37)-N6)-threonylcarbamoyltransferase complex dimerization subunit type 1 TsaB [Clostridia bacterium]|nr:tRNA (adenosine(37)-N6)-threonylcarbamoyltransferase complex dimerization subunit type 1 TsaB [Clostridia bacterium]
MRILSLDTSSKNASVAILENQEVIIELNNNDEKTHSQKLMPMIDEAFQKTNLTLDDISLIACCVGPGSFTGLRIGIATAKAFADSKNIPVVAVNSLEGLAYNLHQKGLVCSLLDAKNGNVYCGLFELCENASGSLTVQKQDLTFLAFRNANNEFSNQNLLKFLEENSTIFLNAMPIYFVGDGSVVFHNLIASLPLQNQNKILFANEQQNIASSISIAQIGYTKYKNGDYGNSDILCPVYLRKSQAEIALEQKDGSYEN